MSPEVTYIHRVSSALERMLRDQGDDWRAQAREVDRRLFEADMLWSHGDYRTEDLPTFVLRVIDENCVLLDESNLRELMHRGWPPESAESALNLIENLLLGKRLLPLGGAAARVRGALVGVFAAV